MCTVWKLQKSSECVSDCNCNAVWNAENGNTLCASKITQSKESEQKMLQSDKSMLLAKIEI